jgi:hypothetical protein
MGGVRPEAVRLCAPVRLRQNSPSSPNDRILGFSRLFIF